MSNAEQLKKLNDALKSALVAQQKEMDKGNWARVGWENHALVDIVNQQKEVIKKMLPSNVE